MTTEGTVGAIRTFVVVGGLCHKPRVASLEFMPRALPGAGRRGVGGLQGDYPDGHSNGIWLPDVGAEEPFGYRSFFRKRWDDRSKALGRSLPRLTLLSVGVKR